MSNENPDNSEDAEPRSRLPMWLKVVGGVALTALTLGALVSFAEPEELWRVWRAVDPLWLAATLGVWLVMMASRASRFYALQPEVGFAKMFGINAIHTFLLRVMPFRTGEMGYVYLVRRAGAPSLAKGFFGVIIVRLLDVVMLFWAFALAVAVYGASALGDPTTGWTLAGIVGIVGVGALARFPQLLQLGRRVARRVCERLGLLEWGPVKKVLGMLDQAVEAEEQMGWRMLGLHIVLSAICWALLFAVAYMFLHTIGLKLAYHEVVLGTCVPSVTALLPVAGVGTFGPLEAGWSLAYVQLGLTHSEAIASAFAYSLGTFVFSLALAAASAAALWSGSRDDEIQDALEDIEELPDEGLPSEVQPS